MSDDDWIRHSKLVLETLRRLEDSQRQVHTEIASVAGDLRKELATVLVRVSILEVKAGLWGALGGAITAAAAALWVLMR